MYRYSTAAVGTERCTEGCSELSDPVVLACDCSEGVTILLALPCCDGLLCHIANIKLRYHIGALNVFPVFTSCIMAVQYSTIAKTGITHLKIYGLRPFHMSF